MPIFKLLWWVVNGLAVAPPAIVFRIGVSTSKNPLPSKNLLISEIIWLLCTKTSFTSGLTIRSRYLCLYLRSGSLRPCHFSGRICRDLVISTGFSVSIDISPWLVLNTFPSIPTISPISYFLTCLNSSPITFLRFTIWIWPDSSWISIKLMLPWPLLAMILPAILTSLPS